MSQLFLSVNNITIRHKETLLFANTSWQIKKGEQWLIVGANGAGKTTFAKALAGLLPLKNGEIIAHFATGKPFQYTQLHRDKIKYISFDTEQSVLKKIDQEKDFASFVGKELKGKTVKELLGKRASLSKLIKEFGVDELLDQEIATLSTGELRKVFLVRAVASTPQLLILDEPFNGLDIKSRAMLLLLLTKLCKTMHIVLITHHIAEIPKFITHVMVVANGQVLANGRKEKMAVSYSQFFKKSAAVFTSNLKQKRTIGKQAIITMNNVSVTYGQKKVLSDINWTVKKGENWAVVGPNGAGKSTLIKLITGDALQVYANDITIFGKKRETLSLWELRSYFGYVSSELQLHYQKEISAKEVMLSGFFDSIGLYKKPTKKQLKKADEWIVILELQHIAHKLYNELSLGQKRLILIARAVVKSPKLLILDEPCQSLDQIKRKKALELIEKIGNSGRTNIILISHHEEEIVPSIHHVLRLNKGKITS